jgi:hypothetical protein
LANQLAQIRRQRRAPLLPRLPSPKNPECGTVPPDERIWLHDQESILPIEKARHPDHREPGQTRSMAWLNLPFLVQSKLLSQEQILGNECCTGEDEQPKEGQQY